MLIWDNESGNLGQQLYNQPAAHGYQLARFFMNENYLTDKFGRKPILIYISQDHREDGKVRPSLNATYITHMRQFLYACCRVKLKVGYLYTSYKSYFTYPRT